jgi:hypothetical protein
VSNNAEKGTCCVCGRPAPDSVVCDDCFVKNVLRPLREAIEKRPRHTAARATEEST